ncbi:hypothetical protein AQUSIP_17210 [Aquicella siphonis]|uniref:DUF2971 domain-containing protein n=2 Tax=Aquicella siphonis TaxID=254247 RepID=A0A5E4PHC3_9COXI|nr:hypothetical protein AQUSIP_17210 [Aquicella siphonis]
MSNILKFYKYQSLSDDKHFTYLQNYLDQKVWLTPLGKFNDPFEGRCSLVRYSLQFVLDNPDIFNRLLKEYRLNVMPELTEEDFKSFLNSNELRDYHSNNHVQISHFDRHGALSLTRKNNNIPMWAYYADNHKGYCVEFELDFNHLRKTTIIEPKELDGFIKNIHQGSQILSSKLRDYPQAFVFAKVRYSKEIPSISYDHSAKLTNEYEQLEYFVKNSVCVKSIEWEHEDEFRLIVNGNSEDGGLLPLEWFAPFLKVTGIIMGAQMDDDKRKHVHNLCLDKDIRIYNAICSNSHYAIVIEPCLNMNRDIYHAIELGIGYQYPKSNFECNFQIDS